VADPNVAWTEAMQETRRLKRLLVGEVWTTDYSALVKLAQAACVHQPET